MERLEEILGKCLLKEKKKERKSEEISKDKTKFEYTGKVVEACKSSGWRCALGYTREESQGEKL